MSGHVLQGNPPIPLHLRRSGRARRISLRVSRLDGRVTLTLPPGVPEAEALDFAGSKSEWIRANLQKFAPAGLVGPGSVIPIEGVKRQVLPAQGRKVRLTGDAVLVPGPEDTANARLLAYLRILARDRLAAASDEYAARLGRTYARITIRDTRSRWGSCSSSGGLMYSWRLILAPPEILRYVAAHEVAHLAEMNHSSAFWQRVQDIHGDPAPHRAWLRRHGPALHGYRFDK